MSLRASVLALSTSPRVLEKRPRPGNGASRFQRWVNGRVPGIAHAPLSAAAALPPPHPPSEAAPQPRVPPAVAAGRCGSGSGRSRHSPGWTFSRGGSFSAGKGRKRRWPWLSGGVAALALQPLQCVQAGVRLSSRPRLPPASAPPLRPLPPSWAEELLRGWGGESGLFRARLRPFLRSPEMSGC